MGRRQRVLNALKCAFPYTIPIFAGFWFLGISYGIYMGVSGFCFVYPMVMAIVIFGGSLEFVVVEMLLSTFAPLQAFLMALMIQARHLFYGISMLDKYRGLGRKRLYLIYGMCDETFSINCSAQVPEDVDRGWFYFWVTLLDQFYWVSGAAIGGLLGNLVSFNTEGLDFVMTALFVVIFLDQWMKDRRHLSEWIGLGASVACLLVFGADSFLIPTMVCIFVLLTVCRGTMERDELPAGALAAPAGGTHGAAGTATEGPKDSPAQGEN